jgi:hypothetical protein
MNHDEYSFTSSQFSYSSQGAALQLLNAVTDYC